MSLFLHLPVASLCFSEFFIAVNPFLDRMPVGDRASYMDDFMQKIIIRCTRPNGDGYGDPVIVPYQDIMVYFMLQRKEGKDWSEVEDIIKHKICEFFLTIYCLRNWNLTSRNLSVCKISNSNMFSNDKGLKFIGLPSHSISSASWARFWVRASSCCAKCKTNIQIIFIDNIICFEKQKPLHVETWGNSMSFVIYLWININHCCEILLNYKMLSPDKHFDRVYVFILKHLEM